MALLQDRKAVSISPNLPGAIYGLGYDYLVLGEAECSIPPFLEALENGEPSGTFVPAEAGDRTYRSSPRPGAP